MKKYLAALLAVTLLLSAMAFAPASAATLTDDLTFGMISQHKDYYEKNKEAIDYAVREIDALHNEIDLSSYKLLLDDRSLLVDVIVHTHPELFYVSGSYSLTYYNSGGVNYIKCFKTHWGKKLYDTSGKPLLDSSGKQMEEVYTNEQVRQIRAEFRARAQWYLDKVDENMSDFDKALVLHDLLVLNSNYILSGETYDLMVNGQGKCYGYSECYSYLLAQVGVKSEIVESPTLYHQWNKVAIDGVYYNVDVTWDDPTPDHPGFVQHTFFLLSDAAAQGYEPKPHYGYTSDFSSTDTRFDSKRYHKINTQLCMVGGETYLVDNNPLRDSETGKKLLTYDLEQDSFETVENFEQEYWSAGQGYYWTKMYMSLQEYDGYLYLNTENRILLYDTETGELSQFADNTFGKQFYGLHISEGKLYAVLADGANETGTLVYIADCLVREPHATDPPAHPQGDVDLDGVVTIADATMLQQVLAEFIDFDEAAAALADVDGNGVVDIRDVTAIQRLLAEFS